MKRIATLLIVMITLTVAAFAVSYVRADGERKMLSPAFEIIAHRHKMTKSGLNGENVTFTLTDFRQSLGSADVEHITVTRIPDPAMGFLCVGSMVVGEGQRIYGSMLSMLEFVPSSADVEIAEFVFVGDDDSSGAGIECTVRLIPSVNYAPTVARVSEKRLHLTAVSGKSTCGGMLAADPEGDAVRYEIIRYPAHGVISSVDSEEGRFVYTSYDGYVGEDRIEYVAVDEYGNYTEAARVSIEVTGAGAVEFYDMDGMDDVSAASVMVSGGYMDATVRGGQYTFCPEIKVTRADFIVMAMKVSGKRPAISTAALDTIVDLDGVDAEVRGYIAAAIEAGYVSAETDADGRRVLRPNDIITKAEAASILSALCGYQRWSEDISVFADYYSVDASDYRAMSAMYEYGVIDSERGMLLPDEQLSRISCARMLYRYMDATS